VMRQNAGAPWPFERVTERDVQVFRDVLGAEGVITSLETSSQRLERFTSDWTGRFAAAAPAGALVVVLQPTTTEQVSAVLRHCHERCLAIVPQGGNTGLVGGSVPLRDEVVLSTERMKRVIEVDPAAGTVVCEAGCVLRVLDEKLHEHGLQMPYEFGAKGSCQVGGNVSTNAGGVHLVRHGSLHGSVLGLEVVLADGTVLDLLRTLRKDNTGYDLKQIFIGAEGTLGVITKVALLVPPLATSHHLAYVSCARFADCVEVLLRARRELAGALNALEFVDRQSVAFTVEHLKHLKDPLPTAKGPFFLLVETTSGGADSEKHEHERLSRFLARLRSDNLAQAGLVAASAPERENIWGVREGCPKALKRAGPHYKYDLSLPTAEMYTLVDASRERLGDKAVVLGYGHIGDGNLHLNFATKEYSDEIQSLIEPFVYEYTAERRGSISAEHGLGAMKAEEIAFSKGAAEVAVMARLKALLDKRGILNPGKVLPRAALEEANAEMYRAPRSRL